MARVPRLTKTIIPQLVDGSAIQNAGAVTRAVGGPADQAHTFAVKAQETENKAWVSEQLLNSKKHKIEQESVMRQERMSNPDGFGKSIHSSFETYDEEIAKNAPTEAARNLYREQTREQNLGYLQSGKNWENSQRVNNFDSQIKLGSKKVNELNYMNGFLGKSPDLEDAKNLLATGSGLYSEDQLALLEAGLLEQAELGYLDGVSEARPSEALEMLSSPKYTGGASFEDAMYLVEKNEGGFVASDGASGAPAIYGINRKWHEEAFDEAQRITESQGEDAGKAYAKQFYKREFWDKFDVAALEGTPQANVVLDGVINHRTSFAKKLVSEAKKGAKPQELIEMRRDEYERLAQSPKHQPSFEGWMNRLDRIEDAVAGTSIGSDRATAYRDALKVKVKKIDEKRKIEQEEIDLLQGAQTGFNYIDPSNSTHKKIVDKHYQKFNDGELNNSVANMDQNSAAVALEFSRTYKVVPESLQTTLKGMMVSGGNEQKAFAYDFVNQANVSQISGFSDKEMQDALTYQSFLSAGFSADASIQRVSEISNPEFKKQREVNKQALKDVDYNYKQNLEQSFDGWLRSQPEAQASVLYDFQKAFDAEFIRTGNKDVAEESALNAIKNVAGFSEITKNNVVMQYPPERYGHPSLSEKQNRKWMQKELKTYFKSRGMDDDLSLYDLFPIAESADLVRQGASPAYYLIKGDGSDYVRDDENKPLVFMFDNEVAASEIAKDKKRSSDLIDRKFERNKINRKVQGDDSALAVTKFIQSLGTGVVNLGDELATTAKGIVD